MVPESVGFEHAPPVVVGQVAEAQGGVAEVVEAIIGRSCGAARGAGPLEVGEDIVWWVDIGGQHSFTCREEFRCFGAGKCSQPR